MTKKIGIKKIETTIPYDTFISSIDGLVDKVNKVTLEVYFTSKKIYELEDTMFVLLDMYDSTGKMKALLVGNRDKDFTSLVDNIHHGIKYRISGNVSTLGDDVEDIELPFINEIKNSKLFCIYALQRYSDTIYGVSQDYFNGTDIKKQYEVISKHTDYLKGISQDEVKDIKFTSNEDIVILLKDGVVLFNGVEKLNNIKSLVLTSGLSIFAISNDHVITCLTGNDSLYNFINNDNCKYRKIIVTPLVIVALTNDRDIRLFGTLCDLVVDYKLYFNLDDIGYVEENDDIVVIKEGKVFSLFHKHDYSNEKPDVLVEGPLDDLEIIGE